MNKAAMEHRGGKFSDKVKDNPTAPSWSQNGATEEEYGCPDGPDEDKRVKRVSWAAKPAEEQPRLNFHIPRKSKEKRALFQYVSMDSREFSDILQILTSSYKDSSSAGTFVYSKPRLVHSEPLEKDFMEKRRELKQDGRTEKELSESFCFLLCDDQKISVVCERGLSVGCSWMNMLGNPSKGVYLCQFSDLLQISPIEPGSTGNIIIFKVIKGKVKSVHDCMSRSMDPTPKFDSHFSKNSTRVTSLQAYRAFEYTQQYFYEYVDFDISSRPRHVCPYAVVSYYFKSKEALTAAPKPLPPLRTSQPSGMSRGRRSYTVWRGHFVNGGKDVYQACLRSLSQPFLPYKLPEKIEIGKVMSLMQVKQKIPPALFSWNLYTGSHEVSKSGMFCSLFDVVEKDKSPKSLTALLQKLEEEGLVLVNMVKDRGFLFLLSGSQMANSSERRGGWKMSCIQALFIYREKRDLLKSSSTPCKPVSSDHWGPIMPQHDLFISALHYTLSKARSDPPADLSATIEQQVYDYLTNHHEGKPIQRIRTDYDPKLDVREKLFPAPRQKTNWEAFMRPYIYNPAMFAMVLENVKKKVEEFQVQTNLSAEKAPPHDNPEKVKELLKLIQLNKKSSKGKAGSPEAMEDTYALKRKVDLDALEGSSKRQRNQPNEEFREADERQSTPRLANVLSSVGIQDTDLRKDKSQSALKVMEMLDSLGKTSLDTDLRKDKTQGALEVIKLIDNLTRVTTESPEDTEMKDTTDISDAALFDSMLRLGLPTDRDIDLRKRFMDDETERTDCLEEETAGSLSSLEAFSPCSDSGGQQRGVNLLGEKTIPWVLIPITGLKTERYSQRKMDYPEDPRFLQSPVVSTHTTPDKKDLSPPYQPDSSNIVVDLDVQTAAEVEDEDPVPAAVNTFSDCPANEVDHIVDEQISGFSSEVEQLLRGNNIYYVSCLSTQGSRKPPQTAVLPLSDYVSNFNTPFPVCNYISSFQDSLKMFIDSHHASGPHAAQEDVSSSSSATEVTSNVPDTSSNINPCASSSSTTKPNTFDSSLRPGSPSIALPDSMTQLQHRSSLPEPDVHEPPQKMCPLEQDSVCQKTLKTNISNNLHQSSHEMNGSSFAETTEAVEGQMAHSAVPAEVAPMEHAHSAISSIIDQLQPEVISNLVEILKGVQKNSVHFYIHSMDEEESDVCWEIKEYLKKLGDLECNPHSFLEKSSSQDKLLVIIQNMDIATQVHKIPSLVSLKKHPSVSFAGVDNLSDIQNHTYNELFQSGGFIVSDEHVLNPAVITADKLQDILQHIEQLNSPLNPWRWRIHFKSHKKLREHSRLKADALNLYEILTSYEKRHIVEILSYHDCDTPSRRAPDLDCLVDLQARFIKQRHLIFLTGFQFEMFPHYSSSGIVIANVDDIKFVISSLASGENVDTIPSAEIYPTPDPASLRDDSMSMDSDQDSTDNSVSVTTKLSHVVTDQHPSLATDPYPPVSEPSLQDQANTIPGPTATSDMPKQLDFKALSEAISQFKASKMLVESDAGETSFRVDPHQSFLNLGDQTDSYPQYSSETHSLSATLSETLVSCISSKIESAVPTMFTGAPLSCASGNAELASSVEASREMVMASGETPCSFKPATPTAVPIIAAENASDILNNPEHWEQSSTSSMDNRSDTTNAGSKVDSGQASNGSSVSENPPMTAVVNTSSFDPPVKNQCGNRGFLPTPGNSRYGMDCFYPALEGSGLISSTPRSMGLNCPRFASHNGAIGFRHPLLNCTVSNNLAVVGPPVLTGFLPSNNMHMTWNNLAQGSASGLWAARYGLDAQQLHRSQFIQNWQGNPAFQGDSYRPNRGGFGGW
ncbi:protein TASOR isoform X1 [Megalobrama amblycephala]|uniref:protein TASOR isoform X1 n=1 Tax=Megalobrama amblycephala TaxID=75352 RepID=UPI002013F386|nr:protein TASOR isoform X1 [Megalobrama amblycephala]